MDKDTVLLALHGFTGCGEDFSAFSQLAGLSNTIHWVRPDLPGHGANAHHTCGADAFIDFIERERVICEADTFKKRILLGYSMGARAALQHACTYPNAWDALILISANPGVEAELDRKQRRQADIKLAEDILKEGTEVFIAKWQEQGLIYPQKLIRPDWYEKMQANRLRHPKEGLANNLKYFGQGTAPNLWPQVGTLKLPTLVITGSSDQKYTEIGKRMDSSLPNSKHIQIKGVSHMPHLEAPEKAALAIKAFIADALG